jgi:hypothetical protein
MEFLHAFVMLLFFSSLVYSLYQLGGSVYRLTELKLRVARMVVELGLPTAKEVEVFNQQSRLYSGLINKLDFSFSTLLGELENGLKEGVVIRRIELSLSDQRRSGLPGGTIHGFAPKMQDAIELTHNLAERSAFSEVVLKDVAAEGGQSRFQLRFQYEKK